MSNRITIKDLENLLGRVRFVTATPEFKWTRSDGKGSKCTVGAYLIHPGSAANGVAWCLQLSINDAGGVENIVRSYTASHLWDCMQSWLDGYDACQRAPLFAAAPDLLAACKALLTCAERDGIENVFVTEARAAIAKATGS